MIMINAPKDFLEKKKKKKKEESRDSKFPALFLQFNGAPKIKLEFDFTKIIFIY